ncbi:hypothetical protein DL96DRAFT_1825358 [Flagelloscypha sp. PMI_526]|nr:hypothetical protein DL96DRAFT_1825358 [Flagelloscypha sp. PMI_526]
MMATFGQGIRVISFDGPGLDASGLSELLILEDIAGKWAWDHGDDREGGDVRVSEICDIVGGTGIGGFYAILFSLNMTIAQVIKSHKTLQNVVFDSDEWERKDSNGCTALLKKAMAQIVEEVGLTVDLDGPFLSKDTFKCYVCLLNDLHVGCARALRSYRVRSSKSPRCSIREAIHATLADGVTFLLFLMKELPAVFPKGSELASFVNLGTGGTTFMRITSGGSWEERAQHVRNADNVAQNLIALCDGLGPCYFRLSVVTGVDGPAMESADDAVRVLKSLTIGYLEMADVGTQLDSVADTLTKRHGVVSLERLGSLAAEDGMARLNAQVEAVHDEVSHVKKVIDDEIYCKIKNWLTPIDQTAKLDACIRARSPSTCRWLWDSPRVIEWKTSGGIFWCHAGMGTGKTILASHVLETLKDLPDECLVAYYYFEFTNPSTLSEEAFFRSIFSQLSYADENTSRLLYENHKNGLLQPQLKSLHKVLHELVVAAICSVYIIVDALDEFPPPGRKYLLESLLELSRLASDGVRVMVTSRDEVDIHEHFSGKVSLDFSINKELLRHDIATFVNQQLAAKKWQSWPTHEVEKMRNILIDKADGMFRMVSCQMEVLYQTETTEDMEQALATLPATLGDTYLYILNKIPSHLRTRARTLLCVLSAALEPVSVTELSALLAVELGDPTDPTNLPTYREGLLFHDPQTIVGLGKALVRRTRAYSKGWWGESSEILQLSHASVKEYLLRGTCTWCWLDDQLVNETTARACLALLIHNEDPKSTPGDVEIAYARNNWWRHILSNHSAQLLSQQKKLFETFPWPRTSPARWLIRTERLLSSPLVFAAAASLEQLLFAMLECPSGWKIEDLNEAMHAASDMRSSAGVFTALIEKGGDVNSTIKYGPPILQFQAQSDRLYIARILIENGADVNMTGGISGSALQAAAHAGALDVVKLLVEHGADVNIGRDYGSALHSAARVGALDVVEFLIENGADVEVYGLALQAAARARALDVVKLLVERGADVNIGKAYGSALRAAAGAGAVDVVEFFVENGAEVGEYGLALQTAILSRALNVVKLLVEHGVDVNMVGGKYGSALQAAAVAGDLHVVKLLVENGADVNMVGGKFGSALQAAAYAGALDVVKFFVENGVDMNVGGGFYGSALQAAAGQRALDVVKFFVENGADVNMGGGIYGSALEAAERSDIWSFEPLKRQEMMTFLIMHGAVRSDGTIPLNNELK